jgi:hypothetical protein
LPPSRKPAIAGFFVAEAGICMALQPRYLYQVQPGVPP